MAEWPDDEVISALDALKQRGHPARIARRVPIELTKPVARDTVENQTVIYD